jgi:hypothetical protein
LALLGIRPRRPFVKEWQDVVARYAVPKNNVGILPLFVRGMQNNLEAGISELSVLRRDDELWLRFVEAGDEYELEVGLYEYATTVLDFRGEKYIVGAIGDAVFGPVGEPEYRIELIFPELPNTRMIKIIPTEEGRVSIELSEVPNDKVIAALIDRIPELGFAAKLAYSQIERIYGNGCVNDFVARAFAPTLTGVDTSRDGWEDALSELNRIAGEQSRSVTLLKAFVERFISVDDEKDKASEDGKHRGIFGGIIDRIMGAHRDGTAPDSTPTDMDALLTDVPTDPDTTA